MSVKITMTVLVLAAAIIGGLVSQIFNRSAEAQLPADRAMHPWNVVCADKFCVAVHKGGAAYALRAFGHQGLGCLRPRGRTGWLVSGKNQYHTIEWEKREPKRKQEKITITGPDGKPFEFPAPPLSTPPGPPYTWEQIKAADWYGKLNADQREEARNRYFEHYLAPFCVDRERFDAVTK